MASSTTSSPPDISGIIASFARERPAPCARRLDGAGAGGPRGPPPGGPGPAPPPPHPVPRPPPGDRHPPAWQGARQPLRLEPPHRLAHGRAAHPQPPRQPLLAQPLTRPQRPAEDRLPQLGIDGLAPPARAVRPPDRSHPSRLTRRPHRPGPPVVSVCIQLHAIFCTPPASCQGSCRAGPLPAG